MTSNIVMATNDAKCHLFHSFIITAGPFATCDAQCDSRRILLSLLHGADGKCSRASAPTISLIITRVPALLMFITARHRVRELKIQ